MSSFYDEKLVLDREPAGHPPLLIACAGFLTAGGVLMVLGSISPWNQWSFITSPETFYSNGLQLGADGSFSIAGLITILVGAAAILSGSMRLAHRRLPRFLDASPLLDGAAGVAVGLYGLAESSWYKRQVTVPPGIYKATATSIFNATAGAGIWLVLVGGFVALVSGVFSRPVGSDSRQQKMVVVILLVVTGTAAFVLAPEWISWEP